MTLLGGGVDKLEVDLLCETLAGQSNQWLSESQNLPSGSKTSSLDHQEILLHLAVAGEAAHGVDGLIGQIIICSTVVLDQLAVFNLEALSGSVDLLVNLGTVMVTLLTSSGNGELDSAGMPCSNTGNLTQTLMGLAGQLLGVPSAGYTNDVQTLVLGKDLSDWDFLLKMLSSPVNLIGNGTTIQLDFHNMSLPLPLVQNFHLGMDNNSDGISMLLQQVQILLDLLLAKLISPLSAHLGERPLGGFVPTLDVSPLDLFADVLSKNSLKGLRTSRSLDITNNSNYNNWCSFYD